MKIYSQYIREKEIDKDVFEIYYMNLYRGKVVYNTFNQVWHQNGDEYIKEFFDKQDAIEALLKG